MSVCRSGQYGRSGPLRTRRPCQRAKGCHTSQAARQWARRNCPGQERIVRKREDPERKPTLPYLLPITGTTPDAARDAIEIPAVEIRRDGLTDAKRLSACGSSLTTTTATSWRRRTASNPMAGSASSPRRFPDRSQHVAWQPVSGVAPRAKWIERSFEDDAGFPRRLVSVLPPLLPAFRGSMLDVASDVRASREAGRNVAVARLGGLVQSLKSDVGHRSSPSRVLSSSMLHQLLDVSRNEARRLMARRESIERRRRLDGFGQRRDAGGISPCLLCHRVFEAVQAAETVSGLCLAGKAVAVP